MASNAKAFKQFHFDVPIEFYFNWMFLWFCEWNNSKEMSWTKKKKGTKSTKLCLVQTASIDSFTAHDWFVINETTIETKLTELVHTKLEHKSFTNRIIGLKMNHKMCITMWHTAKHWFAAEWVICVAYSWCFFPIY